jgi:hypothetical protein
MATMCDKMQKPILLKNNDFLRAEPDKSPQNAGNFLANRIRILSLNAFPVDLWRIFLDAIQKKNEKNLIIFV